MSFAFRASAFLTRKMPVKLAPCRLRSPVASVTFDDFPRSAWTTGGPMLERHGVRATYYAAGRFCGVREGGLDYYEAHDLRAIEAAGHEIASHSYAHEAAPDLSSEALLADAAENDRVLAPLIDGRMSSYAYPFGAISPRTKMLMGERFACARGITEGVNSGLMELAQLAAMPVERRRWDPHAIDAAIARASAVKGWVLFYTHDVSDDPSPYGATPAMLEHVLRGLADAKIESLPVRQAMARAVFGEG